MRAAAAGGSGTAGGTSRGRVAEAGVRRARRPRLRAAESCIVAVVGGIGGKREEETTTTEGRKPGEQLERSELARPECLPLSLSLLRNGHR